VTATQCKHFDVLYLPKERNRQSRERREGDGSRDPDPSVSAVMDEMHIDFFFAGVEGDWVEQVCACINSSISVCLCISINVCLCECVNVIVLVCVCVCE